MSDLVATVIVRCNPPPGFDERVQEAARQTDLTVVVDNASDARWEPSRSEAEAERPIHHIRNAQNLGIATAMNQGIRFAALRGATAAFLLDHDSIAVSGCVDRLTQSLRSSSQSEPIAAVVPRIRYGHPDIRCRWPTTRGSGRSARFRFTYADREDHPFKVDLAISSGMLMPIDSWTALGGFDENLFIDLVDTDYCLRARRRGFCVIADPRAQLQHSLGEVEKRRLLGLLSAYPTNHNAIRHYYLSRNRITLLRRHAVRFPSWAVYELLGALKLGTKVVAFEEGRAHKIAASIKGTYDGMSGLKGPRRSRQ